jgi:hypothetical protein
VLLTPPDASVGTERGAVAHWLLRAADQAMYTAKTSGKARAVLSGSPTATVAASAEDAPLVGESPVEETAV